MFGVLLFIDSAFKKLHRITAQGRPGREDKITNNRTMFAVLKNNAATGYKGPMKTELLKGADLVKSHSKDERH